jgi:hypothetical protein
MPDCQGPIPEAQAGPTRKQEERPTSPRAEVVVFYRRNRRDARSYLLKKSRSFK